MTQYQLVTAGKEKLNEHNVPDADIDAELLWLFVSKQDFILHFKLALVFPSSPIKHPAHGF